MCVLADISALQQRGGCGLYHHAAQRAGDKFRKFETYEKAALQLLWTKHVNRCTWNLLNPGTRLKPRALTEWNNVLNLTLLSLAGLPIVPNPNYAIPTQADRMENGPCAWSLPIAPKMRVHH